jgi:predicted phage terminase large subunit-like protein
MHNLESRVEAIERKRLSLVLSDEDIKLRDECKCSLLKFTQHFYKLRTGREFIDWPAQSRPSMLSQIIPKLEKVVFENDIEKLKEVLSLYFGVAPRSGKTEIILHFVAWAMSHYPDSLFIYVSYSADVSRYNAKVIRSIMSIPDYNKLFGIYVKSDFKQAHYFGLNTGGEVYGVGSGGPITSKGAGLSGVDRFGGAIIIDDIHKPQDAVYSRASREKVFGWYQNTLSSRFNSRDRTPVIFIAQRIHQEDLPGKLMGVNDDGEPNDDRVWTPVILPMIDSAGNSLRPDMFTNQQCQDKKRVMPYVWAAQYQQDPTDDANDTACRAEEWNDYTAFSFLGLYKRKIGDHTTDDWGIHVLNVLQKRIEAENIEAELEAFFLDCFNFDVKPKVIIIELAGVAYSIAGNLRKKPGIKVVDIQRSSGPRKSKVQRFIDMQPHVKDGLITFQCNARFNDMVIDHMTKITPNESHSHDDVADTLQMACEKCLDQQIIQKFIFKKERVIPSISSITDTSIW